MHILNFQVSPLCLFSPPPSRNRIHMYKLEHVAPVCISLFFYLGVGILTVNHTPRSPSPFPLRLFLIPICFLSLPVL